MERFTRLDTNKTFNKVVHTASTVAYCWQWCKSALILALNPQTSGACMCVTCVMRSGKETGRRALARFRLHTLSMTPDARKNVREIVGRQNFSKKRLKKKPQISGFWREKKEQFIIRFLVRCLPSTGVDRKDPGWIGRKSITVTQGRMHHFPLSHFTPGVPTHPVDGINFLMEFLINIC